MPSERLVKAYNHAKTLNARNIALNNINADLSSKYYSGCVLPIKPVGIGVVSI